MSREKQQAAKGMPPRKGNQRTDAASLVIPILVGIVVIGVVVGIVLTIEKRPVAATVPTSALSVPVVTAEPLATTERPNPGVQRITLADAQAKLDSGQAVLIDVRSKEAYDQSHAAGATSIPEAEVENKLGELPRDKLLILY
jgi:hypothetical protein